MASLLDDVDSSDADLIECTFPVGPNEEERIAMLRSFGILDTKNTEAFDRLTSIVKRVFNVPFALISFVDSKRQWFKSNVGLEDCPETHRNLAFCGYAILPTSPDVFVVLDSHLDERFKNNALVTGPPYLRFYAGAPIKVKSTDGKVLNLGTICALDRVPRDKFDVRDKQLLMDLAAIVSDELEQHRQSQNRISEESQRYITCTSHELKTPLTVMKLATTAFKEHFRLRTEEYKKKAEEAQVKGGKNKKQTQSDQREARDMLEVVDQTEISCEMMDQMISNAIDSARKRWQGGSGWAGDFKPVKLSEILQLTERLSSRHHSEPVSFNIEISKKVPDVILSDGHLLRRCLVNLVSNAFKHAPDTKNSPAVSPATADGGRPSFDAFWETCRNENLTTKCMARVVVKADIITRQVKKNILARDDVRIDFIGEDEEISEKKFVRIEVHDTGDGIPQQLQGRIFNESFVHIETTNNQSNQQKLLLGNRGVDFNNRQGSGLGLFVSAVCANELGGTIGYRSKNGVCSDGDEIDEDSDEENSTSNKPFPYLGCVFWIEFPFFEFHEGMDTPMGMEIKKTDSSELHQALLDFHDKLGQVNSSSEASLSSSFDASCVVTPPPPVSSELDSKTNNAASTNKGAQSNSLSVDTSSSSSSLSSSANSPNEGTSPEPESPRLNGSSKRRLLVVDDSVMIQKLLAKNLIKLGYKVDTALNGKIALEKMMNNEYFVVFMDFLMPVLDGISATSMFREWERSQLESNTSSDSALEKEDASTDRVTDDKPILKRVYQPIMGMSANADESDVKAAKEAGIDFFLPKPVKMIDLELVIKEILGGKVNHATCS